MNILVAIQPDDYTSRITPDKCDASSPRWAEAIKKAGHDVKWVDVHRSDILGQLRGCQGFMWRWPHFGDMRRIASRLLPVLERDLGLVVYPDQNTCWHYDDKIAQQYLFEAHGIPTPKTWIWYDGEAAREWASTAEYPMVLKLSAGAGSSNVLLVDSLQEVKPWIDQLFSEGITSLTDAQLQPWRWKRRIIAAGKAILRGRPAFADGVHGHRHKGYLLLQEFLPENAFDTRVTVVGNRAFGYRRFNRPGDFRASGSGNFDTNPQEIDPCFLRLAFRTARTLRTQSLAIDGLQREQEHVLSEISYTYVSWMVHACPGHWELQGDPQDGDLIWCDGHMWPEEAQVADFLHRLETNCGS